MRISTNYALFNNYNKTFFLEKSYYNYDEKNISFKRIDNSKMAILSGEAKTLVVDLSNNLAKLKTLKEKLSHINFKKQAEIKKGFQHYIESKGKNDRFKTSSGMLNITQPHHRGDIIRIHFEDENNSNRKLFMIEDLNKFISNIYINTPYTIPPIKRYMTEEEIERTEALKYVNEANNYVLSYISYLEKFLVNKPEGVLNPETVENLNIIYDRANAVEMLIEEAKKKYTSAPAILRLRCSYENYAPVRGSHIAGFKEGENILYFSILKNLNYAKVILKDDKFKDIKAYLIDVKENKVFQSKENKNNKVYVFSEHPKFLTQDEIENSDINKYIELIKKHMINYEEAIRKELDRRQNKVKKEIAHQKKEDMMNINPLKNKTPEEKTLKVKREKEKTKKTNRVAISDIDTNTTKKKAIKRGDLLPEFEGAKRKEFPKVLKLSEIDELFEEITGQTINEAAGIKGNAPIPQPYAFQKEVTVTHSENNSVKQSTTKKQNERNTKLSVGKPQNKSKRTTVEPSIWGLAKYLDENKDFSVRTSDNAVINVALKEIEGIEYISIIKTDANNKRKYFNIDADTQKLLKTDLTRKPMLVNDDIVPYSESDLKSLGLQKDFDSMLDELFTELNGEQKTKALEPQIKILQKEETEVSKERTLDVSLEDIKDKAKIDAREFAEVYFNTFLDEFKASILKKLEDFEKNKFEFLNKLLK